MRQTSAIDALLIHSPLVGPSTVGPFAAALSARGWNVATPDLRSALAPSRIRTGYKSDRPAWRAIVELILAAEPTRPDAIIGHSGAGVLLPIVAGALDPKFVCFIDAVVPQAGESYVARADFVEFIDSLDSRDGLLPPWNTWWGTDVMAELVPDSTQRADIVADTPRVPRSFYDDPVALPSGWHERRGHCMLQLSPGYDDDRARAAAFGWATDRIDGRHLDIAVKPALVCNVVLDLLDRIQPSD